MVHVEAQYNHLGTLLDRAGHQEAETRRRLSIAASAFDASRRLLLQSRHVEFEDRVKLLQSLVTSTIFNLELWCCKGQAWTALAKGYAKLARRLLVGTCDQDYYNKMDSGTEVFLRTGLFPLHILAARKRLGFLTGLANAGNDTIWAIVQLEETWAAQIREDLNWMVKWSDSQWLAVHPGAWAEWWPLLTGRATWFKKCARRAAANWRRSENEAASARVFLRQCVFKGIGSTAMRFPRQCERKWRCPPCQQHFKSRAGLSVHFHKCHGRVACYRYYAVGTQCEACGVQFFSERRLLLHMKTSRKCCDVLAAMGRRCDEPCAGIRSQRKGREDFILCPPQPVSAPSVQGGSSQGWHL